MIIRNHGGRFLSGVMLNVVQILNNVTELLLGLLVQVRHSNPKQINIYCLTKNNFIMHLILQDSSFRTSKEALILWKLKIKQF